MNHSKIAVRYAKALLELAIELKQLSAITKDVRFLETFLAESRELRWLINSPIVSPSEKSKAFQTIFANQIQEESMNFLLLLVKNGRESFIPDIFRNYLGIMRQREGIKFAHFSSVILIDEETLKELKEFTEEYFNSKVELSSSVKESLLGGFTLQVEDQLLDASIQTKLKHIKQGLLKA